MILYIGNKLSKYGVTPTSVETLGAKLQEIDDLLLISDKKNKVHRFFDAIFSIIKHRNKISLILIDTYSTSNFYYALVSSLVARLFNISYVPILHGGALPDRLKSSPYLSHFLFKNAAINISPSHYLLKIFLEAGFDTEYIPNFVETGLYPTKCREKLTPRLLYVRSFHEIYNPKMAIRVLAILQKKYSNIELCMVGPNKDGSKEAVEVLAAELGVSQHLKITGKLSKEAWIVLSSDYDIFINTTNFDNLPVSIIEAMCLGFPIVSTNAGGLPFLIEDGKNGLLVDKNDAEAMAENIIKLLEDNSLANEISKNAINKGNYFDWKIIKKDWRKTIEKLKN